MSSHRNQQTGTLISVESAAALQLDDGAGSTKWYTICEAHSEVMGHSSGRLARYFAASPIDWCEGCRNSTTEHDGR